jgi:hypothetical protein
VGNRVTTADSRQASRYPAASAAARPLHHRLYARRSPGSADGPLPRFAGEVVESFAHDAFETRVVLPTPCCPSQGRYRAVWPSIRRTVSYGRGVGDDTRP